MPVVPKCFSYAQKKYPSEAGKHYKTIEEKSDREENGEKKYPIIARKPVKKGSGSAALTYNCSDSGMEQGGTPILCYRRGTGI